MRFCATKQPKLPPRRATNEAAPSRTFAPVLPGFLFTRSVGPLPQGMEGMHTVWTRYGKGMNHPHNSFAIKYGGMPYRGGGGGGSIEEQNSGGNWLLATGFWPSLIRTSAKFPTPPPCGRTRASPQRTPHRARSECSSSDKFGSSAREAETFAHPPQPGDRNFPDHDRGTKQNPSRCSRQIPSGARRPPLA